jgi:hypothetical protein
VEGEPDVVGQRTLLGGLVHPHLLVEDGGWPDVLRVERDLVSGYDGITVDLHPLVIIPRRSRETGEAVFVRVRRNIEEMGNGLWIEDAGESPRPHLDDT